MQHIRSKAGMLAACVIVLAAVAIRLQIYGDLRLSIANDDTPGYITASEAPLFSWEAFTGRRLFTTNLFYSLLSPPGGYEILVNGSRDTTFRQVQPTFVNLVRLQAWFACICWSLLALVIASRLRHPLWQAVSAGVILVFAFLPQLADWDSILTSESLTFSLFALQLCWLLLITFRLAENPALDLRLGLLIGAWLVTVFLWTFLRDTHLYALPVSLAMCLGLLALPRFRRQAYIPVTAALLAAALLLGWASSSQSVRSQLALRNVYSILGSESTRTFMQERGMPERGSPEYDEWFPENARSMYFTFLLHHPGYVTGLYLRDSLHAFQESSQPYYNTPDLPVRNRLLPFSEALHPENPVPLYLDLLLLAGVITVAVRRRDPISAGWAWLTVWLYLFAQANLFVVIFGDAYGITRHALLPTTVLRLFMWLIPIVLIDLGVHADRAEPVESTAA